MRNPYRCVFGASLAACLTLAGCTNTVVVFITPAPTRQVSPFGAGVAGNVFFSKTANDQSSSTCQFGSPVTTVSTTDSFYMIAAFNDTLQSPDAYSLDVVKDGVPEGTTNATATTKFNCYREQNAMGPLPAGTYQFTFTHGGVTEAQGTITITP